MAQPPIRWGTNHTNAVPEGCVCVILLCVLKEEVVLQQAAVSGSWCHPRASVPKCVIVVCRGRRAWTRSVTLMTTLSPKQSAATGHPEVVSSPGCKHGYWFRGHSFALGRCSRYCSLQRRRSPCVVAKKIFEPRRSGPWLAACKHSMCQRMSPQVTTARPSQSDNGL